MSEENTKNVFISHYNQDDEHIGKLKTLLDSKGYQIRNSSIDSTKTNEASNTEYIKRLLRERISWSGNTIVLIGPETHTREWVDWEIEESNRQGKSIIGVYIQGAKESDLPENFEKYGDTLIGWNGDKIIDALNGKSDDWVKPDGTPWVNKYKIDRQNCT